MRVCINVGGFPGTVTVPSPSLYNHVELKMDKQFIIKHLDVGDFPGTIIYNIYLGGFLHNVNILVAQL